MLMTREIVAVKAEKYDPNLQPANREVIEVGNNLLDSPVDRRLVSSTMCCWDVYVSFESSVYISKP